MNSLISITIPTELGIDIYSAKVIKNIPFYIQTIKEGGSGIFIEIKYSNDKKELFDIESLSSLFIIEDSHESVEHFNELYNGEFNSSVSFKIFDLIDKAYFDRYGYTIVNSPLFKKYNELHRKFSITEKTLSDTWRKFDENSRVKITSFKIDILMDDCKSLLMDPYKNEYKIIESLEFALREYKKIMTLQNSGSVDETLSTPTTSTKTTNTSLTTSIKKNKFGQFVYDKYNLVFDPKDKCIIGTPNGSGSITSLTNDDIRLCNKIGIEYRR